MITKPRTNIPARNYGRVDGESMGKAINFELIVSWRGYRYWAQKSKENPYQLTAYQLAYECKREVRLLCAIRKAGRIGL